MFVSEPVGLRRHGVLVPDLPRGHPLGHQGVQLDGHALQGLDQLRARRCSTRFGFLGLFTIGGLTGLFLGALGLDVHVHDTYFVVAHFHYVMVGGTVMAYLGGLHYWWPKMTGRMYPEGWAKFAAVLVFVGFNLTFFPQFILGYLGMPRRYHVYPDEFQVLNVLSTAGASILGVGYVIPIVYLTWSLFQRREGGPTTRGAPPAWSGRRHRRRRPRTSTTTPVVTQAGLRLRRGEEPCTERGRRATTPRCSTTSTTWSSSRTAATLGHVGVPGHRSAVLRRHVHGLHPLPDVVPRRVVGGQPPPEHHAGRCSTRSS